MNPRSSNATSEKDKRGMPSFVLTAGRFVARDELAAEVITLRR